MWERLKNVFMENTRQDEKVVSFQMTGESPANSAEDLIKRVIGERQSVSLRWLEEQIGQALYREELGHDAWVLDIGTVEPASLAPEVARILGEIRPEFASLVTAEQALPITMADFKRKSAVRRPSYGDC